MGKPLFKSKTVWAGIIAGATQIVGTVFPIAASGALGEKAMGIANGVAMILGAVGIRSAISKK